MTRWTKVVMAVGVATLALASTAEAQKYIWIGGALSTPIGDSKDFLKSGWLADVGVGIPIKADKLDLQIGGLYGSSKLKDFDLSMDLMGAFAGLSVSLTSGKSINPYIYGHGGMLKGEVEELESDWEMMFQFGGGVSGNLGANTGWWIDVRYLSADTGDPKLTLMPLAAGITWRFGN